MVLLWDGRWPQQPGVCCWRQAARAAFAATGATVREVSVPSDLFRSAPRPSRRRAVRVARRTAAAVGATVRRWRAPSRRLAAVLAAADLVVAETPEAARLALMLGVPGRAVWPMAAPAHPLLTGADDPDTRLVAALATRVGGFLVLDEAGRESVERAAAATIRPRVEVFPPVAGDRSCPVCGGPPGPLPPGRDRLAAPPRAGWGGGPGPAPAPTGMASGEAASNAAASNEAASEAAPAATAADQERVAARIVRTARPDRPADRPTRDVVVSGYDLKFVRELAAALDVTYGLRMQLDEWPDLHRRSPRTRRLAARAQTILAEWARPSAAWLARHKRPGQLLVVRLHRYELTTNYPAAIDIERVDAVVHVSRHIGREIVERLGWPEAKLIYIPNYVDIDGFDRPKLPDARFGIGAVGIDLANKRFDLMLDVVAAVRRQDPRFTLFVRTTPPWTNRFGWARASEREYVGAWLRRIDADPWLRGGVVFDPPGRDMARWYRRVGVVLSTSDVESFHLAVAEGMASGAVPVIRPREGAAEIFGPQWIQPTVDDAVATILSFADEDVWRARSAAAKECIRQVADPSAVLAAWADLLHGDIAAARRRFG